MSIRTLSPTYKVDYMLWRDKFLGGKIQQHEFDHLTSSTVIPKEGFLFVVIIGMNYKLWELFRKRPNKLNNMS